MSKTIYIEDKNEGYPVDSFAISDKYSAYLQSVLIPAGMIQDRIERMAIEILMDREEGEHGDNHIHALCVLNGGYRFFSDLLATITRLNGLHTHLTKRTDRASDNDERNSEKKSETKNRSESVSFSTRFIKVKSYSGTESTGQVVISDCDRLDDLKTAQGAQSNVDLLIVEDIIDTGNTMVSLIEHLKREIRPRRIRVASLLTKRHPDRNGYRPDFVGFNVPFYYLVGAGLDYNDHFRELNHICVLNDDGKKAFAQQ